MRIEQAHKLTITTLLPYLKSKGRLQIVQGDNSMEVIVGEGQIILTYLCNKEEVRQTIYLEQVPSNLGRGQVIYFVCPATGNRCRNLYRISCKFYSRLAYRGLVYSCQLTSGVDRFNDRYWKLHRAIEKLTGKGYTPSYRGRKTATARRVEALDERRSIADLQRMYHFMKKLDSFSFKAGYS